MKLPFPLIYFFSRYQDNRCEESDDYIASGSKVWATQEYYAHWICMSPLVWNVPFSDLDLGASEVLW